MANRDAERARKLVGTRFRAQGRDPKTGLDCAGLAIAAFRLQTAQFRRDYRLRGDHRHELESVLERDFRRVPRTQCRAGDLLMLAVAADQLHLAIKTGAGFVHADAKHGKVVETPGEPRWKTVAVYRRRARSLKTA
jgi:murein DD-endopeptidase / murein LD-carboxypeptidase